MSVFWIGTKRTASITTIRVWGRRTSNIWLAVDRLLQSFRPLSMLFLRRMEWLSRLLSLRGWIRTRLPLFRTVMTWSKAWLETWSKNQLLPKATNLEISSPMSHRATRMFKADKKTATVDRGREGRAWTLSACAKIAFNTLANQLILAQINRLEKNSSKYYTWGKDKPTNESLRNTELSRESMMESSTHSCKMIDANKSYIQSLSI